MKRMDIWRKILEKRGLHIVYTDYDYWDNVPAVFIKEQLVPLAVVRYDDRGAHIVQLQGIIATEDNLNNLIYINTFEPKAWTDAPAVRLVYTKQGYTFKPVD